MSQRARSSSNKRSVTALYDGLKSNNQRAQIDRLIEEQNRQETNLWAQWELASIEVHVRKVPGLFGKDKFIETTQIRVILKRLPRTTPKVQERKPPVKSNNYAGITVDLFDPPAPAPSGGNASKGQGDKGGGDKMQQGGPGGPMGPGGPLPPPNFVPMEHRPDPRMMPPPPRRGSFRGPSPGPRGSGSKLERVINYLDRMAIRENEPEFDYIEDEEDWERSGRRRQKYDLRQRPVRKHSRHRSRSRGRRGSNSSFDMLEEFDTSSSGSSSFTDATPPLLNKYGPRPRSGSRGRLEHRKPPALPLYEPKISYNFFGDASKDSPQFRRRSDVGPYGGTYARPVLPLAPEVPLYGGAYNQFLEAPTRRSTFADEESLRREAEAFQRGREQEHKRNLEEKMFELKKKQQEERLRRIEDQRRDDEIRRREDEMRRRDDEMRRMEDGIPVRRFSRSYSPTDPSPTYGRR